MDPHERIAGPAAPPRWWAGAAATAAVLSLAVVVVLWLRGDGPREFEVPGGLATGTGRLAGLVASDLLLIQVLLMARIPWVERSYGQDTLARWHRVVGFTSFWFMVTHIVLITVGYAGTAGTGLLAEVWGLVTTYPGILLAAVGSGLLLAVVGLSVRFARARQRYEIWHLLHLYAYIGVGLALPHQIWVGGDFATSPLARLYWWGIYVAALVAVLVFRVGVPVWRSAYHRMRVREVVPEAPGVVSVLITGRHLDRLPVRAGQFFLWRFLDGPGWSRAHPYTLSAVPRTDLLRITVKQLGDGSGRVARLRPGTRVLIEGPYGVMTAARTGGRQVLLIAAGVGITTMRAMLEDLVPAQVTLLYRISDPQDAIFRGELDAFVRHHGVRVLYLEGNRPRRGSWLPARFGEMSDHAALRWLVPDVAGHDVFVCGPRAWMDAVRGALLDAGVAPGQVHTEEFAW